MIAPHASDIINGHLSRLEAETADLPSRERHELVDGVREHIAAARAEMPEETDAALLNLLDRLGDPADLAELERSRLGLHAPAARRVGLLEIGALVLTPLVWPIGVILLWTSGAWNTRDKLIGTLLPPGGLFTSMIVFTIALQMPRQVCNSHAIYGHAPATTCSGGLSGIGGVFDVIVFLLVVFSPILTGIYMGIRLRQRAGSSVNAAPA